MEIVNREDVEQFLSEFHQKLKITDASLSDLIFN